MRGLGCGGVQGTADAVRQYLWMLENDNPNIRGSTPSWQGTSCIAWITRSSFRRTGTAKRTSQLAALPVDEKKAEGVRAHEDRRHGRIVEFAEKPKGEALTECRYWDTAPPENLREERAPAKSITV